MIRLTEPQSILDGWVHPADREKPEYAERWARYCREAGIKGGWVEPEGVKPSVKCKALEPVTPLHSDEPVVVEPFAGPNAFEAWFLASGLSKAEAARRLGISRPTFYAYRQKGAPADVMAALAAPQQSDVR
jgi:predicted DNA-binding protein (UPF0251 family)